MPDPAPLPWPLSLCGLFLTASKQLACTSAARHRVPPKRQPSSAARCKAASSRQKKAKSGPVNLRPKRNAASRGLEHADNEGEHARGRTFRASGAAFPGGAAGCCSAWRWPVLAWWPATRNITPFQPSIIRKKPSATTTPRWTTSTQEWEGARQKLAEVKRNYGYSRYARLAELRLADAGLRARQIRRGNRGLQSLRPRLSERSEIPYARYKVTLTQYDAVSASFLLPPLEERDLAYVNDAHTKHSLLPVRLSEQRTRAATRVHAVGRDRAFGAARAVRRALLPGSRQIPGRCRAHSILPSAATPILAWEPEGLVLLAEVYLKTKERLKARAAHRARPDALPDQPVRGAREAFLGALGQAGEAG